MSFPSLSPYETAILVCAHGQSDKAMVVSAVREILDGDPGLDDRVICAQIQRMIDMGYLTTRARVLQLTDRGVRALAEMERRNERIRLSRLKVLALVA